jgi:hypothetical protein
MGEHQYWNWPVSNSRPLAQISSHYDVQKELNSESENYTAKNNL